MKGLVFTELLEYVENNFGFDMADKIIEEAKLPNNGSFTQAGNYPFEELVRLVVALSKESNIEVPKLLEIFGEHMFSRLISLNPQLKDNFESSLDLISRVDDIIHPEVQKLYPGADLPKFNLIEKHPNKIVIDYISENFGLENRVVLWGQSLGAAVAFLTAESDARVDALISESTYSDFESSVGDFFSSYTGFNSPFIERVIIKRVSRMANFRPDDISPLKAAKNIHIPVLIVHGNNDNKINPVYANELFLGLASNNKRILIIPGASHLDVWNKGGVGYFAEVDKFLNTAVLNFSSDE